MKKEKIILIFTMFLVLFNFLFSQHTVSTSSVWYASLLKQYFSEGISILRMNHPLDELPCLPQDITKFNIQWNKTNQAFQVKGTLKIGEIISPFIVPKGAKGSKYMLILKGYILSSQGRIIWQQQGYAIGDSWISAKGETVEFRLINSLENSTSDCTLLLLAVGTPIFSDYDEDKVILGVKKINL